MKLLHTSDWHLGRLLYNERLIEDQHILLDQIIKIAEEQAVCAVLVSGDIFDRAVPPPDAIPLFSRVVERLCIDLNIPVIMIAGNHDSENRLDLAPRVFNRGQFHLVSHLTSSFEPVVLSNSDAEVAIYPIPYAGPMRLREVFDDPSITSHNDGMKQIADVILEQHNSSQQSVLMAHGWVAGGSDHGEERPLSVGSTGEIAAAALDGFDYVAMGHLHRRQKIGERKHIGYPGSLMQYDFGERAITPSVDIITIEDSAAPIVTSYDLAPRRLLHTLHGSFDKLMDEARDHDQRNHYVRILLTDDSPVHSPFRRLKENYPFLLHLQYENSTGWSNPTTKRTFEEIRETRDIDLFTDYFKRIHDRELNDSEREMIESILEQMSQEDIAE